MADEVTPPLELEHALRHVEAARDEWASGHQHMAAMHLREAGSERELGDRERGQLSRTAVSAIA